MECRRTQGTAVVGALQSPPSVSRRPQQQLQLQPHQLHRRRRMHEHDCNDEYNNNNNNNSNNSNSNRNNVSAISINNNSVTTTTTLLVDELEQLRTDNFQLRLRVYNAERRVDRLSAAAALDRDRNKRRNDSETSSSDSSSSSSSVDDDCAQKAAAATATAAAAVRTIHDLLTVNRRLLALLAATVSAKAVAVSPDDKRRWRRLRNHIEDYSATKSLQDGGEEDEEYDGRQEGDDSSDASTSESETNVQTARAPSAEHPTPATGTRLRSPPPPQPREPDRPPAPDDDSAGSELSRLRARCRRLERSLQQLVNTELWARNRQISKLEQQRYVTQVAAAQTTERAGRPPAAVTHHQQQQPQKQQCACPTVTLPAATTKGILVVRSPESTRRVTAPEVTAAATTITTPPPVLPDYSEVNFFFSCDEEEDDDQGNSETNTLSSASIGDDTESDDVRQLGRLPATAVRAETVGGAPVHVQPRKRQCRPHHHHQQQRSQRRVVEAATTTSSSTDCAAAVANGGPTSDLCGGATPPLTPHRTFSGTGGRQRPRRRRYRQRRCSGCARRFDDDHPVAGATCPPTAAVADAQVQCSDDESAVTADGDVRATVAQLRRELDARRRENCRLYDMLLRRRKGRDGPSASFLDDDDDDATTDSNADGSPEPYRRAARAVRGRIADLLPPLLSMRSTVDGLGARSQQDEDDRGTEQGRLPRDDRQAMTLARLRERIEAYERQQLGGRDDDDLQHVTFGPDASGDPAEDDVLRMDRAALVNVALPRAVDRLRRAILQRLPEEQQPTGQDDPTADLRTLQLQQGLSSVDYNDVDRHRVER